MAVTTFISSALLIAVAANSADAERQSQLQAQDKPVIQLRLEPPKKPLPQVAAELRQLEQARKTLEGTFHAHLQKTANVALEQAKKRIDNFVNEHRLSLSVQRTGNSRRLSQMGFVASRSSRERDDASRVKINVYPMTPPNPQIRDQIDNIEGKLTTMEKRLLEQAEDEMQRIADIVLSEASARIGTYITRSSNEPAAKASETALVEGGTQVDVRIAPSAKAFPTVRTLVEEMEQRLDKSERNELDYILKMEKELFEAELAYLVGTLQHL